MEEVVFILASVSYSLSGLQENIQSRSKKVKAQKSSPQGQEVFSFEQG